MQRAEKATREARTHRLWRARACGSLLRNGVVNHAPFLSRITKALRSFVICSCDFLTP